MIVLDKIYLQYINQKFLWSSFPLCVSCPSLLNILSWFFIQECRSIFLCNHIFLCFQPCTHSLFFCSRLETFSLDIIYILGTPVFCSFCRITLFSIIRLFRLSMQHLSFLRLQHSKFRRLLFDRLLSFKVCSSYSFVFRADFVCKTYLDMYWNIECLRLEYQRKNRKAHIDAIKILLEDCLKNGWGVYIDGVQVWGTQQMDEINV